MTTIPLPTVMELTDSMERSLVMLEAIGSECDRYILSGRWEDMRSRLALLRRDLGAVANTLMERQLMRTWVPPVKAA